MGKIYILEEKNGIKLCRQEDTDEYKRIVRSIYIITDKNNRKIGQNYPDESRARVVFDNVVADNN